MVRYLRCPNLFVTFSAADLHWDSFFALLPEYSAWKEAHGTQKFRIARLALRDNPYIAIYHFYARFNAFIEHFLNPKFNIADYWTRQVFFYIFFFYFLFLFHFLLIYFPVLNGKLEVLPIFTALFS